MSSDIAIKVNDVSKHYLMFERPEDRLKQMIVPRLQRAIRQQPKGFFRDFAALNGVSFEIGRGVTVGIIGRNGCGKSTLLQIVCGTLQPTYGTVEVNGRVAALLELGAGFNPEFTGRENVYLNGAILGLSRAEIDRRFDDIARFADIGIFIDQPVKTYSSGMYVRLAFAVAINVDPDILVVDEALAVGDEAFQRKCFARIEDIKDKGGTILFVSHGAQTIVQLCDRAMLFDRGEMILEGRPKTVVSQYQRLVNAPGDSAEEIRAHIAAEPSHVEEAVPPTADSSDTGAPAHDNTLADYFDQGLKSQSVVEHESRGAVIRDVGIATLDDKPINVLRIGRRYVFSCNVDVFESFEWMSIGFSVRTKEGVLLYGFVGDRSQDRKIHRVPVNSTLNANFEFRNALLGGVYFVNFSVFGFSSGERRLAHSIGDAISFRVASDSFLETGFVELECLDRVSISLAK